MELGNEEMSDKIDADDHQIRLIVNTLYNHILRDYIAHANERKILNNLYRFYTESDLILISKQQLRIYQEIEKLSLRANSFDITNPADKFERKMDNG